MKQQAFWVPRVRRFHAMSGFDTSRFKQDVDYDSLEPAGKEMHVHEIKEDIQELEATHSTRERESQRLGTWTGRMLSRSYRIGWPQSRARESNSRLGHPGIALWIKSDIPISEDSSSLRKTVLSELLRAL